MSQNILYINPLGEKIHLITNIDNIKRDEYISFPFFHFAEEFPKFLTNLFSEYNFHEIWLINGPGTFTAMRIISLTINSLKFSNPNLIIKSRHLFDIIDKKYTPIISANNNEVLIRENMIDTFYNITSIPQDGKYSGYIVAPINNITFTTHIDHYEQISKIFKDTPPVNYITPIYIKPPHITGIKKT